MDPDISIVDIVLPHYLHAEVARTALQAGKHVVVEKPMALTANDANSLVRSAAQHNRRLFVKSYQRSSMLAGLVASHCTPTNLGRPMMMTGNFESSRGRSLHIPNDWRAEWHLAGGGVLFDTGYHFIDLVIHLFGPARAVTATCFGSAHRPKDKVEDVALLTLEMANGVLAQLTCSWASSAATPRWRRTITCENGSVVEEDRRTDLIVEITRVDAPIQRMTQDNPWSLANQAALHDIFESIANEQPSKYDGELAIETLNTVLAAYRSSSLGQRLELDHDSATQPVWSPGASVLIGDLGFSADKATD